MLLSSFLMLGALTAVYAEDNPFKNAKVGDWTESKVSTIAMGNPLDMTLKQTVAAKDDMFVTVKTTMVFGKMEVPGPEIKIDLSKPYDAANTAGLPAGAATKIEKDGAGKEKIKVGGKEYDCEWTKFKASGVMGQDAELKVWTNKDAPLSGVVKMEMKSKQVDFTMELTGSGSAK
jgi:hypothetical protein